MYVRVLFCCLFLVTSLFAQKSFVPAKADTVVFAGDSITHQCIYTQFVENFLYTRYHDLQLRCFNTGISGDKALDLLNRFDEDVAFKKPQWVTVLLGMNDGRYQDYSHENFGTYKKHMKQVLEKIKSLDAEAIVLSPTMFDQQQYRLKHEAGNFRFSRLNAHENYNAKLGMYSGWLRATANDSKLNFVDFWGPMNDITASERINNSAFTLSPDSIHPDPNGMAIMATQLANYMKGSRAELPKVLINFGSEHSKNVKALKAEKGSLEALVAPVYLPWVLPATNEAGPEPFKYIDNPMLGFEAIMERYGFNEEIIQITGLQSGKYNVLMNDKVVLKNISSAQLAAGIDISKNTTSPTYQQSLNVAQLNVKRNNEAMRPYRNLQASMKGRRKKFADQPEKLAAYRKSILPQLNKYLELAKKYEEEIHQLAVPKKYTLKVIQKN